MSRRCFLKRLGASVLAAPFVTRDLIARPPSGLLRHASFGAGGMAWLDINELTRFKEVELVAVADVDMLPMGAVRKRFPDARIYQDWRQMLDVEEKSIDSVNVSTPDHVHAVMALAAMQMGKHVYAQKPLAHDLHEVRRLTEYAARKRLATQMGIQVHATAQYPLGRPARSGRRHRQGQRSPLLVPEILGRSRPASDPPRPSPR